MSSRFFSNPQVLLFVLIWMGTSCKNDKNAVPVPDETLPIHIDLIHNLDNEKGLFLSDFADSVSYVPLETREDCFVKEGAQVKVISKGFLIIPFRSPVLFFDTQGKFVSQIGKIGKGPGEYRYVIGCHFNEKTEKVYIYGGLGQPVAIYILDGVLTGSLANQDMATYFHLFGNGNSILLADYAVGNPLASTFYCMDSTGNLVKSFKKVVYKTHHLGNDFYSSTILYPNESQSLLLPHSYDDTVSQINADFSISPFCIFNLGANTIPQEALDNMPLFRNSADNYIVDIHVRPYPTRILVSFKYLKKSLLGCFDRTTRDFYVVNNLDTPMTGIRNDMDGGPSYQITLYDTYNRSGNLFQAVDLLNYRQKGYFSESNSKNPEDHARFLRLLDTLNENDNPVVMITYKKQ